MAKTVLDFGEKIGGARKDFYHIYTRNPQPTSVGRG